MLLGELHRADTRATNDELAAESRDLVSRFLANGYPRSFISCTIRSFNKKKHNPQPIVDCDKRAFVRVPFVNKTHKRRILALLRRSGLSNHVRIWFDGGKPLRSVSSSERALEMFTQMWCLPY